MYSLVRLVLQVLKYYESNGVNVDGKKIIFPLLDRYKNVLGFTKRWLNMPLDADDKYKNSPNSAIFNKGMYLYGLHKIDMSFKEIRITEGSMDVILSNKYGAKNVVATLGTAFTENHVELIKHYNLLPVFCMDGDDAGLKSIQKSASLLAEHNIYCKILILPPKKDMADIALELKDKLEDYINKNSITYGNYLIKDELSLYISKVNELKMKSYPNLLKIIQQIPCNNERDVLKAYIKNIMNIEM